MSSNGHKLSLSTQILMQFVLNVDERCIGARSEFDIAKDGGSEIRSYYSSLESKISLETYLHGSY